MEFFNPKLSAISVRVSLAAGTIQLALAKALNPNFKGRPEKNQKVYDRDHTCYFSLRPIECLHILNNLQSVMEGTYENPKEKIDSFRKVLSLTHFKNNQPSRLILDRHKDGSGNYTGAIVLTIIPVQGEGFPVTYAFRFDELTLFKFYLSNGVKNLDFFKDLYESNNKINFAIKKANQEKQNKQDNKQGGQSNYEYNQSHYEPPDRFDNGQDQSYGSSVQDINNVNDINFGFDPQQ